MSLDSSDQHGMITFASSCWFSVLSGWLLSSRIAAVMTTKQVLKEIGLGGRSKVKAEEQSTEEGKGARHDETSLTWCILPASMLPTCDFFVVKTNTFATLSDSKEKCGRRICSIGREHFNKGPYGVCRGWCLAHQEAQ